MGSLTACPYKSSQSFSRRPIRNQKAIKSASSILVISYRHVMNEVKNLGKSSSETTLPKELLLARQFERDMENDQLSGEQEA